jgi:hypothetical protein
MTVEVLVIASSGAASEQSQRILFQDRGAHQLVNVFHAR